MATQPGADSPNLTNESIETEYGVPVEPEDRPQPLPVLPVETVDEGTGLVLEDVSQNGNESDDDVSEAPNLEEKPPECTI
jgi:hypothetical protein